MDTTHTVPFRFERPALVLRLAGLILGGVMLPGALTCVLLWMGAINGMIRHGFSFSPYGGWWSLARPEAWMPLVGCVCGVALVALPGRNLGWLTRRMAR